jgi:3-hydroxyisobutyrate dehydrogenase-like beta-hydroxyacid dehydrogenase
VVSAAGVVITMLPTAAIVLDVVEPLLENWPEGTIWLQMSSVGQPEADQLTRTADTHTRSHSSTHPSRAALTQPRTVS